MSAPDVPLTVPSEAAEQRSLLPEQPAPVPPSEPAKVFVVEVAPSRVARAIGPVVIASAVLTPLLLLPYFATRAKLRHTLTQLEALQSLPKDLSRLESQLVPELRHIRDGASEVTSQWSARISATEKEGKRFARELNGIQKELDKLAMRVEADSEAAKIRAAQPPAREVKLVTVQEDPRIPTQLLNEIGSSLSSIAAFMEELEIKDGLPRKGTDPRGIDKMRALALKLEKLSKDDARVNVF